MGAPGWLNVVLWFAAGLTAVGVIWKKAVQPLVHFFADIAEGVAYVQAQMVNNGGSTVKDTLERTGRRVDEIAKRMDRTDARLDLLEEVHRKQEAVERLVVENTRKLAEMRPTLHLPQPKEQSS